MGYKLQRDFVQGKLVGLSLGVPEVDDYLEFLKYHTRLNTWLSYAYDLQVFLNVVKKPVTAVTAADVFDFIKRQRDTPPRHRSQDDLVPLGSGLSARTVRRRLAAVAGLYAYLVIKGDKGIAANPVPRGLVKRNGQWGRPMRGDGGGVSPLIRTPTTLPRPLEREEVDRFLDSMRTQRDRAMVLLMLLGGLRKSEVLGLSLRDLDFGQGMVLIREGKGGHQRQVPVATTALQAVLRYLNEERPASSSSDRVFLILKGPHRGRPLNVPAVNRIFDYHRDTAGTAGVQCHRLRHTCLTRLRQAGMSLEALQAQAGHRSIMSTRIYLHLCPKELKDEFQRVSDLLFAFQGEGGNSRD